MKNRFFGFYKIFIQFLRQLDVITIFLLSNFVVENLNVVKVAFCVVVRFDSRETKDIMRELLMLE